ncbi:Tetratricopeptide repeat protein 17 [Bienertia sinuspersici]
MIDETTENTRLPFDLGNNGGGEKKNSVGDRVVAAGSGDFCRGNGGDESGGGKMIIMVAVKGVVADYIRGDQARGLLTANGSILQQQKPKVQSPKSFLQALFTFLL